MAERNVQPGVYIAHFRFHDNPMGTVPGVERVMATQLQELQNHDIDTVLIVGENGISHPTTPGDNSSQVIVYGAMRIDEDHLGFTTLEKAREDGIEIARYLEENFPDRRGIIHNPLLAARYNAGVGVASALLADRDKAVPWVHDIYPTENDPNALAALHGMIPTRRGARIAVISDTRYKELLTNFDRMTQSKLHVPQDLDIRVIPNPISDIFFSQDYKIPHSLQELVPNFDAFTASEGLQQGHAFVENLLFTKHDDTITLILNGRPVHNKGIIEAIKMTEELTKVTGQKVTLVITNGPDTDMQINKDYWNSVKEYLKDGTSSNIHVVFLGGADRQFMPWLYRQADLLIAPFMNEGFGLPPAEAALCDLASVISDDPALRGTTGDYAKVIPLALWQTDSHAVAKEVAQYLISSQRVNDLKQLQVLTQIQYSPDSAYASLAKILQLS